MASSPAGVSMINELSATLCGGRSLIGSALTSVFVTCVSLLNISIVIVWWQWCGSNVR